MLDNLEELKVQLAQLRGELDAHYAAVELESERLLTEFPKRDMLQEEVRKANNGYLPFDSKRNWNIKKDLVSWLIEKNMPINMETLNLYYETQSRIYAAMVGITYPQWQVIYQMQSLSYAARSFWQEKIAWTAHVYTDGGVHYFSVLLGGDAIAIGIESDVVYLEGKTPAAPDSFVYLAIQPDGETYLVDSIRFTEIKYDIGMIRYGELKRI